MNIEVGSNNSNFKYWYVKSNYPINIQNGIVLSTYFKRGVVKYDALQGAVKLKKCTIWFPVNQYNFGMHAMEVLPIQFSAEQDGILISIDGTNYDNWIGSIIKAYEAILPDSFPEEEFQAYINNLKELYVEISKEEFEEIYNNAEN